MSNEVALEKYTFLLNYFQVFQFYVITIISIYPLLFVWKKLNNPLFIEPTSVVFVN